MRNHEVIIELLNGEIKKSELTDHQREYWERVSAAYDMMVDGQPSKMVMGMLQERHGLSRVQAWRTVKETQLIFSNMEKVDKLFHRQVSAEMALKAYAKAEAKGDVKSMIAATRAYNEATGLHLDDVDAPDWSKIQPHTLIILPPQGQLPQQVQGGVIDLNEIAQSLPYEAIDSPTASRTQGTD